MGRHAALPAAGQWHASALPPRAAARCNFTAAACATAPRRVEWPARCNVCCMSLALPLAEPSPRADKREQLKLGKRLRHQVGRAIADFGMIEDGDKVMACLSGGKDSYTMLDILLQLQRKAPVSFSITAVNLDQKQPGFPEHVLPDYLRSLGVDFHVIEQDTYSVVSRVIPEGKTMCSLCSRLRRGALYAFAEAEGFTKVALGHHRDDLVATFFLNLFFHAKLSGMPPKLLSDDSRHVVIRPLAYVREEDIAAYADARRFPIIPCNLCGSQENLKRKEVTRMIAEWDKKFPGRSWNVFGALSRVVPTHLMDKDLCDFAGLKASGIADEAGDKAFDPDAFAEPSLPFSEDDEEATMSSTVAVRIKPGVVPLAKD
jgi:tRNA 2-thiocytidine biosynthesis protein TtcA